MKKSSGTHIVGTGQRLSLVIGNSKYANNPLINPGKDADDVSAILKQVGFDVFLYTDINKSGFVEAAEAFVRQMQPHALVLIYFSGHAVQIHDKNYLIPVDNNFQTLTEAEITRRCVGLHELEEIILNTGPNNQPALVVIILDACRTNPIPIGGLPRGGDTNAYKGLAPVSSHALGEGVDLLYLFATAPGKVADDAPNAPNGLFTGVLLDYLDQPIEIEALYKQVTKLVVQRSGDLQQCPWKTGNLRHEYYLAPKDGVWLRPALNILKSEYASRPDTLGDSNDTHKHKGQVYNPYKGLLTFDESDADIFFGREEIAERLLSQLNTALADKQHPRLIWVLGASGSGKSSLVRAGIIPELKKGKVDDSRNWLYLTLKPGDSPIQAIAKELSLSNNAESASIVADLLQANDDSVLLRQINNTLAHQSKSSCLLFIDQFEQLITQIKLATERDRFIKHLLAATSDTQGSVIAIVTLRTDWLNDLMEKQPELADPYSRHQIMLTPMQPDKLRSVIEKPAQLSGLTFEGGLVDKLLEESKCTQGSLPLLEYVLYQMGKEVCASGHGLMQWDSFRRLGGVAGVLTREADKVFDSLEGDSDKELARTLFLRLVMSQGVAQETGRSTNVLDLWRNSPDDERLQKVINTFIERRLLTGERDENTGSVILTLSHESLIRYWPRLSDWIEENRDDLRIRDRLMEGTAQWLQNDRATGYLWREEQLAEAQSWRIRHEHDFGRDERSFLDASWALMRQQKRRESRIRTGLITLTMIAIGAAAMSFNMKLKADRERYRAEEQQKVTLATKLIADVQNLISNQSKDHYLKALLSAESLKLMQPSPLADQLLREELSVMPRRIFTIPRHSYSAASDYSPNGSYILIHDWPEQRGYRNIPARLFDTTTGQLIKGFEYSGINNSWTFDKPDPRPQFCPNSDCLYFIKASRLYKLEIPSGRIIPAISNEIAGLSQFSPNGKYLLMYGTDYALRLYDIDEVVELLHVPQPDYRIAMFSTDSKALWTIADEHQQTIRLIDIASGKERMSFHSPYKVAGLEVNDSGKFIQTISFYDGLLRANVIWDTQTGKPLEFPFPLGDVAIAPKGNHAILWPKSQGKDDHAYYKMGQLWDLRTHKPVSAKYINNSKENFSFGSDNDELIASSEKSVTLWNLVTNKIIRHEEFKETISLSSAVAISPFNGAVAVKVNDELQLWQSKDGKTWYSKKLQTNNKNLFFAKTNSALFAGGTFFDSSSGETVSETQGYIYKPFLSPNLGRFFDSEVKQDKAKALFTEPYTLWNMTGKKGIARFQGHSFGIGFTSSGETFYNFTGKPAKFNIVNLRTGVHAGFPGLSSNIVGFDLDDSGKRLLSFSDNAIEVRDIYTDKLLFAHNTVSNNSQPDMSKDGKSLVLFDEKFMHVFDIDSGKELLSFGGQIDEKEGFVLSPNKTWLIANDGNKNNVVIWNLKTGAKTGNIQFEGKPYFRFSDNELFVASFSYDQPTASVYELPSVRQLYRVNHEGDHESLVGDFVPGSSYFITSGGLDKSTRVWSAVKGQEYRRWPGTFEAAAEDGDRVMTHHKDALHVWSIATGKELANVPLPKKPAIFSTLNATFSPDARHILMLQDGVAKVIAIENQETISTIRSEDKTSLLLTNLFASTSPVKFSPDGKYIAVSTMEESWLSLWRPEDMLEEACQRVSRNLSHDEWRQYFGDEPYRKTCAELPEPTGSMP